MPELPEVETIKIGLQKYVVGHKIVDVEIKDKRIFQGDSKDIIGGKVEKIERAGKGLIIDLNNGYSLAIHIKLTGQLIFRDEKTKNIPVSTKKVGTLPSKFTHVIFKLDKDAVLYYNDMRKFGWIKVVKTEDVKQLPFFKELGPEPFGKASGQADLSLDVFQNIVSKANIPIKPFLMDQKKIGGIGNIYANDALYDAKIDPRRKAKSLGAKEIERLYKSILKVLKKGLETGGASELQFVNVLGQDGGYQKHFEIYGQDGKKCKRDGEVIKKIFMSGRGTYFCPGCQK